MLLYIGLGVFALLVILVAIVVIRSIRIASPSEAIVISGSSGGREDVGPTTGSTSADGAVAGSKVLLPGTRGIVWPLINTATIVPMQVVPIEAKSDMVQSNNGINMDIGWFVTVQVGDNPSDVRRAAKAFPGGIKDIHATTVGLVYGIIREVAAKLKPEELRSDKLKFAQEIGESVKGVLKFRGLVATGDFVLTNVNDAAGLFIAQGEIVVAQQNQVTAIAKANAERETKIQVAEADREARVATALARQTAELAELEARETIAKQQRILDVAIAENSALTEVAQVEANNASKMKTAELDLTLAKREGEAQVVRQEQAKTIAERKNEVAQLDAQSTVVIPAKAKADALKLESEAQAAKDVALGQSAADANLSKAKAEATATELRGGADAKAIESKGLAEATVLKASGLAKAESEKAQLLATAAGELELANARSAHGALNFKLEGMRMVTDAQVKISTAVGQSMADMQKDIKVVHFGGSPVGGADQGPLATLLRSPEVLAKVNEQVHALTGQDLSGLLAGFMSNMTNPLMDDANPVTQVTSPIQNPASTVEAPIAPSPASSD